MKVKASRKNQGTSNFKRMPYGLPLVVFAVDADDDAVEEYVAANEYGDWDDASDEQKSEWRAWYVDSAYWVAKEDSIEPIEKKLDDLKLKVLKAEIKGGYYEGVQIAVDEKGDWSIEELLADEDWLGDNYYNATSTFASDLTDDGIANAERLVKEGRVTKSTNNSGEVIYEYSEEQNHKTFEDAVAKDKVAIENVMKEAVTKYGWQVIQESARFSNGETWYEKVKQSTDVSNKQVGDLTILKLYSTPDGEQIAIAQAPNGRIFNYYGWDGKRGTGNAGNFKTVEEAEHWLKKHRPQAVEVRQSKSAKRQAGVVSTNPIVDKVKNAKSIFGLKGDLGGGMVADLVSVGDYVSVIGEGKMRGRVPEIKKELYYVASANSDAVESKYKYTFENGLAIYTDMPLDGLAEDGVNQAKKVRSHVIEPRQKRQDGAVEKVSSEELAEAWRPLISEMIRRGEIDAGFGRELHNRPYKYFTGLPSDEVVKAYLK